MNCDQWHGHSFARGVQRIQGAFVLLSQCTHVLGIQTEVISHCHLFVCSLLYVSAPVRQDKDLLDGNQDKA